MCNCQNLRLFLTQCCVLWVISTEPVEAWESKSKWFLKHVISKICIGSTGKRWNSCEKFPRVHYIENSRRDSKMMTKSKSVNQSHSKVRIIMSMYNDIDWESEETEKIVLRMLTELQSMLEDSREGHWSFWELGLEKTWYGIMSANLMVNGTKLLKAWCSTLPKAGHPVFRASKRLGKRRIEKRRKRSKIHSLQR